MGSLAQDCAHILEEVRRPGDFCVGGTCRMFAPSLEVEGVGPIALPLLPIQAEQLVAVAERAPFGRGEETLVDIEVRRAWQIGAERVRLGGQGWAETFAAILERAAEGLGVTGPVEAQLYKLLVYETGGFFVGHRDTEKAAGMFATLVVALPSRFTGGEMTVRHAGREVRLDLAIEDPGQAAFAAFYADCVHEISPVTSGARLVLVYNLVRSGKAALPQPPDHQRERDQLAARLRKWAGAEPSKLVHLLEHAYTPAGLAFDALKGADAARAATLAAAAAAADCDLHLALLTIEESGAADNVGSWSSRRRSDRDADFEIVEVNDSSARLSCWRRPDGEAFPLGELPVDLDEEISPPEAVETMVPDEVSFSEATGNEGASFERTYRRAALVLWPRRRRATVVADGGLAVSLPWLEHQAQRWRRDGRDPGSPVRAEALELAACVTAGWPRTSWPGEKHRGEASRFLDLLGELDDTAQIEPFLRMASAGGVLTKTDSPSVLRALARLSGAQQARLLECVCATPAPFEIAADLLAGAVDAAAQGGLDLRPADLHPAGAALLAAFPGVSSPMPTDGSGRPRAVGADVVANALHALDAIDPALAEAAVHGMLAQPAAYRLDEQVTPALLSARLAGARGDAVARLRDAVIGHLRARIAMPLAPPADWARPNTVTCSCAHCRQLAGFLQDPQARSWRFKAPQHDRMHVEAQIRQDRCDVDCTTLRQGSPHVLACEKNQASYEARARQRRKDLAALATLEGPG